MDIDSNFNYVELTMILQTHHFFEKESKIELWDFEVIWVI